MISGFEWPRLWHCAGQDRSHAFRTRASMPADGRKSRRSASSNFNPTPVGGGSGPAPTAGGLETEQGAGRRGACAGWTASEAAGGAAGAMLLRWDVCDGVWKGIGVWKGDVMWMRVDGEALASPLTLICVGEAPASSRRRWTPAPDRRRLGSFGERRARRRRRLEATRCRVSADPLARCSCVPLPSAPRSRSRADACTARVRACRRAIEKRAGPRVYALRRDGRSTERPSDEAIRRRGRGEGSRRMRRWRRRHGGGGGARRMRRRRGRGVGVRGLRGRARAC